MTMTKTKKKTYDIGKNMYSGDFGVAVMNPFSDFLNSKWRT